MKLNIAVLLKQVPDLSSGEERVQWVCAPQDLSSLQIVSSWKKDHPVTITAISMGPDRVVDVLRTACSLGADRIVHIHEDPYDSYNPDRSSKVIARWIQDQPSFDLIFSGVQSPDSGSGLFAPLVAGRLGIPLVSYARSIALQDGHVLQIRREVDDGIALVECEAPLMVSVSGAVSMEMLKPYRSCSAESPERFDALTLSPPARKGKERIYEEYVMDRDVVIIEDEDPSKKATELVRLLREEVKVI